MSRLSEYLDFDEYFEFIHEWNKAILNPLYNPKAINIAILFNGALDCLMCLFFPICTKEVCFYDFDKIEIYDEWNWFESGLRDD